MDKTQLAVTFLNILIAVAAVAASVVYKGREKNLARIRHDNARLPGKRK